MQLLVVHMPHEVTHQTEMMLLANPTYELIVCTALTCTIVHVMTNEQCTIHYTRTDCLYIEQNNTSAQDTNRVIACRDQHRGFKGCAQT